MKTFAPKLLVVLLAALTVGAHAAPDMTNQSDLILGSAELVFPGMSATDAGEAVRKSMHEWGLNATLSARPIPNTNPKRPGKPSTKTVNVLGIAGTENVCDGAVAEIRKQWGSTDNQFMRTREMTQACLYHFEGGIKGYLVHYRFVRSESLTAGLFKGITKAIAGDEPAIVSKALNRSIDLLRKDFPSMLIERVSIPGKAVLEPDAAAVAKLIPPMTDLVAEVATALPGAAGAQIPAQVAAAAAPINAQQAKVSARKDLTGMGLTFHSQEQFLQSIRRKDDVAVSLFLAGGGVDPAAADPSGMTPLALAESLGATDIVLLLKQAAAPVKAVTLPAAVPAASAVGAPAAASTAAPVAIPAELKAKIDAQIDASNFSPEQKEVARANAYRNVQAMLQSAGQFKAMAQNQ